MSDKKMSTDTLRIKVKELRDANGWGRTKIADYLGEQLSRVGRALAWIKKHEDVDDEKKLKIEANYDEANGSGIINITTRSLNVKTMADAIRVAKVDTTIWEVTRWEPVFWETTMGSKKSGTGKPETYTNCRVKLILQKKKPGIQATERLIKTILSNPPKLGTFNIQKIKDAHLLEVGLVDQHFAKLAWEEEVGHDFDLNISEEIYMDAVKDFYAKTSGYPIDEILLPVGQDFFHINNPKGLTPKGSNHLDMDSRLTKVFEVGERAVINAVNLLRQKAKVRIAWVPGNHDPETSFYLCRVIQAWFRSDSNVIVDVAPTMRKHYRYGVNFIGMTHGDEEPVKELPRIFMDEFKEDWLKSNYKEIHIGHTHKVREINFVSTDSFGSTRVRTLPSLTGTDAWHYLKGYVQGDRAAQAFLWNKHDGLTGYFESKVKPKYR